METILTKDKLDLSIKFEEVVLIFVAFLLSRVDILNGITPFGIAFMASYIILGNRDRKILITVILSIFLIRGLSGINYYMSGLAIYFFFSNYKNQGKLTLINSSIIACLVFFAVGVLYKLLINDMNLYSMMTIGFEALLIFTMTYVFSFSLSNQNSGFQELKNEKLICTFITFALVISGISNIIIFDLALKNLICIFIVIYLSYSKGIFVGSAAGIVLGMVTFISNAQMPFIIALLGVGAILAGLFNDLGKIGSVIGFILGNTIVSFYINGLGTSFFNYKEIILSSLLFFMFSSKLETFIDKNSLAEDRVKKSYENKKFELASNKLNNTRDYLESISHIFEKSYQELDIFSKEIIYDLIKDVDENKCSKCLNHNKCWSEDYYKTYYSLFTSIGILESNRLDSREIIKMIFEDCQDYEGLYNIINMLYKMYKKDEYINKRYVDQNMILVEQIKGLSRIIEDIDLDIYKNPTFNQDLESLLEKEIKDKRIDLSNILFVQLDKNTIEIYMEFYSLNSYDKTEKIVDIVSKALGYQVENAMAFGSLEKTNSLKLIRTNRYNTLTKIKRAKSSKDDVSGDNFTFGRVDNTKYIAISDGMGTGDQANNESKATIEILERMLELGGDKEMTLKSINNILRTKSEEEIFTTLDLGFIDLYTGKLELIKSGAAPTFIKRKDECLVINSKSLPMGIFNDVDFNIYNENLKDGDIVIMMSDGVLDANKNATNPEKWMKDLISGINSTNPEFLSDEIFNTAKLANRNRIEDDMTLLVTKVWKAS